MEHQTAGKPPAFEPGSRVTVDYGDGRTEAGTFEGTFSQADPMTGEEKTGVTIRLDNGRVFDEFEDTLRLAGVTIGPEAAAPTTPASRGTDE